VRVGHAEGDPGPAPVVAAPVAASAAATPAAAPAHEGSLRTASDAFIHDTLRQHGDNISAAARALGVSRGLLYRRLRRAD
jgi:transcriptional regulator of acetoin/glycerol metabolism